MTNGDVHKAGIDMLAIKESLDRAMNQAGGASLSLEVLQGMTADYFLSLLAPNGIRFVHTTTKKK